MRNVKPKGIVPPRPVGRDPEPEVILFVRANGVRLVNPALFERQALANQRLLTQIAPAVAALEMALKEHGSQAVTR